MADEKIAGDLKALNIPEILPIIPLINVVVFPKMILPFEVFEANSLALVDEAMATNRLMGLVLSKKNPLEMEAACPDDPTPVGTCVAILKMAKGHDNRAQLLVQGISRIKIVEFLEGKPYRQARIKVLEDAEVKDIEIEALMVNLVALFDRVLKLSPFLPPEFRAMAGSITEGGTLADMIASIINASPEEKQNILETQDVKTRLQEVTRLVNHQVEILELGNKIQSQVKNDMDKVQREYYLRQQLKAIKQELNESEETNVEINEYRDKIDKMGLPEEVKKEAERELGRLARMHPSSSEYTVASTYLDWLTALPWNEGTEDRLDIKQVRRILDEDHFGLEKAKKRIIEYLSVRKLKPDTKGPILCFVGPPGTGKTSLGHSIGRALGRKFFRISLGGVRDEAEIRGHRRTYVGALPGRIIQGIRKAASNNPLFMLDEIDKVGSDFRGDPSSALLEVLDPEQNSTFVDHYLNVPFDLSRVMFITTANILDTTPPALRDRLEVIELSGYTQDEKIRIAERYLIPRQIDANGLKGEQINISRGAVKLIISGYTREAGVRNLEREIASLCRSVATQIVEGKTERTSIALKDVHKYLGPLRISYENTGRIAKPGVAVGLAWTASGGDLLFIEATAMKGKGGLTLTGQLGDVMKESA
ncbi:MAG: endopeptidase La, partial [Syntrophales bacterium]|nr:endopeptidase La [Syntrophales bacterium]